MRYLIIIVVLLTACSKSNYNTITYTIDTDNVEAYYRLNIMDEFKNVHYLDSSHVYYDHNGYVNIARLYYSCTFKKGVRGSFKAAILVDGKVRDSIDIQTDKCYSNEGLLRVEF